MAGGEFTNAHPALARFWHPVALSAEVGREPVAFRLGGQGWALARFSGGIAAFADACPHRRARLSAGQITGGTLQCAYHGWRFTRAGRCVDIPALVDSAVIPERATLRRPAGVAEQDGLVWLAPEPRARPSRTCTRGCRPRVRGSRSRTTRGRRSSSPGWRSGHKQSQPAAPDLSNADESVRPMGRFWIRTGPLDHLSTLLWTCTKI